MRVLSSRSGIISAAFVSLAFALLGSTQAFAATTLVQSFEQTPTTGSIEITKYLCPYGTTVNRDVNGVGDTVPTGCIADEGVNFGYVYNPAQSDGNGPWDEFDDAHTEAGDTESNGVLTIPNLPVVGRYVIFETNGAGNKVANTELLGLYCDGDGDPDPNHNDNGDIALLTAGQTTKCVAYNEAAPEPTPTPQYTVTIKKYVDGAVATSGTFPMKSTWTAANLSDGVEASGIYDLNAGNGYTAATSPMDAGADYTTEETFAGNDVGATCADGKTYGFVGYSVGADETDAIDNAKSTTPPDFTNLQANQYAIVWNKTCPEPVETATVTMCKKDEAGAPLEGWTLWLNGGLFEENISVPATNSTGKDTANTTVNGTAYVAVTSGTWLNTANNIVDAEYSTINNWLTYMDGFGVDPTILELKINGVDGDWGPFNSDHVYAQPFVGNGSVANFAVQDSYYGDNSGELEVDVYKGYVGVTGQDGCVAFKNVPYDTYEVSEIVKAGWSNISGLGKVGINSQTEEFVVVNKKDPITGDITIIKTVVNTGGGTNVPGDFIIHLYDVALTDHANDPGVSGGGTNYAGLLPDTYTITETGLNIPSYSKTFTGDCNAAGVITLAAGESKTCTITNTFIPVDFCDKDEIKQLKKDIRELKKGFEKDVKELKKEYTKWVKKGRWGGYWDFDFKGYAKAYKKLVKEYKEDLHVLVDALEEAEAECQGYSKYKWGKHHWANDLPFDKWKKHGHDHGKKKGHTGH